MSGGSYNYAYCQIEGFAGQICQTTPLRKAFVKLLVKVAKAARDIEWVDSGDDGPGDEDAAIRDALGPTADAQVLAVAVEDAKEALKRLQDAIERTNGKEKE